MSYKEVNMFTESKTNLRAERPKISNIFDLYHLKSLEKNIVL